MKFKPCLFILLAALASCKKNDISNDDSRFDTKIMILGHAGMGLNINFPNNSRISIHNALQMGCDGSEIDVQMTLDSILVAYHDDDLSTQTNCSGKIHESNWKDIQSCILNRTINKDQLVNLDDLFATIENIRNYYFSLDCKVNVQVSDIDAYQARFMRAIQRLCSKYKMEHHCLIEGPKEFLLQAKALKMKNPLFLFSNNDDSPSEQADQMELFGISIPMSASEDDLKHARSLGIRTMVWSPVSYNQNKEILAKKPDIIQTDDPISLLKLTNRFNYESVRP